MGRRRLERAGGALEQPGGVERSLTEIGYGVVPGAESDGVVGEVARRGRLLDGQREALGESDGSRTVGVGRDDRELHGPQARSRVGSALGRAEHPGDLLHDGRVRGSGARVGVE
jgi:hypothetical protein